MFISTLLFTIWSVHASGMDMYFLEDGVAEAPTCDGLMKQITDDNFYTICSFADNQCEVAAVTDKGTCREFCETNGLQCVDGQDNMDGCTRNTNTYSSCDRQLQTQVCVCSPLPRKDDQECNEFNFSALFYKTSDECKEGVQKGVTKESICKCHSEFPEDRGFDTFDCVLEFHKGDDGIDQLNPKQALSYAGDCPPPKEEKDCESCVLKFFNNGGCTTKKPLSVVPEGCMHCGDQAKEVCEHFEAKEETSEDEDSASDGTEGSKSKSNEESYGDMEETSVGESEEEKDDDVSNDCDGLMKEKTDENYYTVCMSEDNQCEVAAVTNKGTCREFCETNGLQCVDGQDNMDGCTRNTNTYNSCDRQLQTQVCICGRIGKEDDSECNEFNFSKLLYETTDDCKSGVMKGITKDSICKCHSEFPADRGFDSFDCVLEFDKADDGIDQLNPKQVLSYAGGCPAPKEEKTCKECVLEFFNDGGCTATNTLSVVPDGCENRCGDEAKEVCEAFEEEDDSTDDSAAEDDTSKILINQHLYEANPAEFAVGEGEDETEKKANDCGGMLKPKTDDNYYTVCSSEADQCEVAAVTNQGTCSDFCEANGLDCVDGQDNASGCNRNENTYQSCHRKLNNQICVCSATPKEDDGECNEFNFSDAFVRASEDCQKAISKGLSKKSLCKCAAGFPENRAFDSFDCTLKFDEKSDGVASLNPKQALGYIGECPVKDEEGEDEKMDCSKCVLEFFNAGGCTAEDAYPLIPDGCMDCGIEAKEVCSHFHEEEEDTKKDETSTEDKGKEGGEEQAAVGFSKPEQQIWTNAKYFLVFIFLGFTAYFVGQHIGNKKREKTYLSYANDTEMSAEIYGCQ